VPEKFLFYSGYAQTGLFAGIDDLLALGRQSMSLKSQVSSPTASRPKRPPWGT
jgi:hypothetical protein